MTVPDLEVVDTLHEAKHDDEPAKSEKKRKRKGKGKMVVSQTTRERKRIYVTRNESQKLMGDALAANEEPISTPLHIGSSETNFDDIVRAIVKRKKEAEVERVKSKEGHKSVKKALVKKESVSNRATVKSKPVRRPGPPVQKPVKEKVLTREERIAEMEKQRVLNGIVFDPEILTKFGLPKKFLKGEYQLMFEFINKVLVPRTEKRTVASSADFTRTTATSSAINQPQGVLCIMTAPERPQPEMPLIHLEEYSTSKTLIPFDQPVPLLQGPTRLAHKKKHLGGSSSHLKTLSPGPLHKRLVSLKSLNNVNLGLGLVALSQLQTNVKLLVEIIH
ncbi:hypothetical protein H5410_021165 [Solanum commersonii]|uniref:Uncharacterized protein n=1 Tax=Solanum commersonii TaxID=4109 RepID=A0A9J5ZED6_SOLCO|nr:hypothetical protein H5410_021165 [Solanum commersonii]